MVRAVVAVLAFTFVSSAFADDGSSGCGLGWQVTKRKSLVSSSVRATTNGLFYNNTLGMTSGTSGCEKHSLVKNERAVEHFVEANYNNLMVEMAKGEGEYVQALAYVMGCDENSVSQFSTMTRKNYGSIFTSDDVGPQQLIQNVKSHVSHDSALAASCSAS
jgi:hypothetical protein